VTAKLTGSATVRLVSQPQRSDYDIKGSGRVLLVGPDGKTTELARMRRPDEEIRAQRERERDAARAERERQRERDQAERDRERERERAQRERDRN